MARSTGDRKRPRARIARGAGLLGTVVIAATAAALQPAAGASSTTVISATVPSATNLTASTCGPATPGSAAFGTVLPGGSAITTADCTVTFGSSNDTARLRVVQDDTFGSAMYSPTNGAVDAAFAGGTATFNSTAGDEVDAVLVQPDGKVLVGGSNDDYSIVRFLTDGTPDPGFGAGGIASFADPSWDGVASMALQADGKIVVTGYMTFSNINSVRFNANGTVDTSYGTSGRTATGGAGGFAAGVVARNDGTTILSGATGLTAASTATGDTTLVGHDANGQLLTTFGTNGVSTIAASAFGKADFGTNLYEQSDGKLLVVGGAYRADESTWDAFVARVSSTGQLDTAGYGTAGIQTLAIGSLDDPAQSASKIPDRLVVGDVQVDDKLVVAVGVHAGGGAYSTSVRRLTTAGVPDPTFGSAGVATLDMGPASEYVQAVHVQPDGRVLVGALLPGGVMRYRRLESNGTVDSTFGTAGVLDMTFTGITNAFASAGAALGADGGLLVGAEQIPATKDFAIKSFAGVTIPNYGAGNDWATAGAPFFAACLAGVGAGTTSTWPVAGTCSSTDVGSFWRPVPATTDQVAVASAPNTTTSTASLRFAMRASSTQAPGSYVAPVRFEVVAP